MNKYDLLWKYVANADCPTLTLSFDEIEKIAKIPIDHSFLTFKKELNVYGWCVDKISLKNQTVSFVKTD